MRSLARHQASVAPERTISGVLVRSGTLCSGLARGYVIASALMLTAAQWRTAPVAAAAVWLVLRERERGDAS